MTVSFSTLGMARRSPFLATRRTLFSPRSRSGRSDAPVRMGINLGPVRLVKDINGQPILSAMPLT
jgi:hypothetical protein